MNQEQKTKAENDCATNSGDAKAEASKNWKSHNWVKPIAMYLTMVCVSTIAIYRLEHASVFHAVRTALVAAIGKTFAANWGSGIFD